MRTTILGIVDLFHALALGVVGAATLWWSDSLMLWLIWLVGEERALGADNVYRLPEGSPPFLTNPGAMVLWTVPFWLLGIVQLSAAATLVRHGYCSLTKRAR